MAMRSSATIKSLHRYQLAGFAGTGLLIGAIVIWAVLASIQGAVIAPGVTVVETYLKRLKTELSSDVRNRLDEKARAFRPRTAQGD